MSNPPLNPQQFYHGTVTNPTGRIDPLSKHPWLHATFPSDTDPDYAYATSSKSDAWNYAEKAFHSRDVGHPRVFRVRQSGEVEQDPQGRGNYAGDVRSKHGFDIEGEEEMPENMGKPEDWK